MPYIICAERTEDGQALKETSKGIAERAHHPEELRENKSLTVDGAYYLANQVGLVLWLVLYFYPICFLLFYQQCPSVRSIAQ